MNRGAGSIRVASPVKGLTKVTPEPFLRLIGRWLWSMANTVKLIAGPYSDRAVNDVAALVADEILHCKGIGAEG
jgi:hypothetical protein